MSPGSGVHILRMSALRGEQNSRSGIIFPHFIEFQDPAVKGPVPRRDVYLFTSVPTSVVLTLASVPTSEYVTIKEGGRCSQCMDEII